MKGLLILLSLLYFPRMEAQVISQIDSAFHLAKTNGKPVLLVFSGSDWCPGCMRFEKKVLRDSVFAKEGIKQVVILRADFPQRSKLSTVLVRQNDSLAAIYNKEGLFPHIVLLNANDSKQQRTISYTTQSASEFTAILKTLLPTLGYHD